MKVQTSPSILMNCSYIINPSHYVRMTRVNTTLLKYYQCSGNALFILYRKGDLRAEHILYHTMMGHGCSYALEKPFHSKDKP
jgi:hypothetical protein